MVTQEPYLFLKLSIPDSLPSKAQKEIGTINELVDKVNTYTRAGMSQKVFDIDLLLAEISLTRRQLEEGADTNYLSKVEAIELYVVKQKG